MGAPEGGPSASHGAVAPTVCDIAGIGVDKGCCGVNGSADCACGCGCGCCDDLSGGRWSRAGARLAGADEAAPATGAAVLTAAGNLFSCAATAAAAAGDSTPFSSTEAPLPPTPVPAPCAAEAAAPTGTPLFERFVVVEAGSAAAAVPLEGPPVAPPGELSDRAPLLEGLSGGLSDGGGAAFARDCMI